MWHHHLVQLLIHGTRALFEWGAGEYRQRRISSQNSAASRSLEQRSAGEPPGLLDVREKDQTMERTQNRERSIAVPNKKNIGMVSSLICATLGIICLILFQKRYHKDPPFGGL